jgi:hypothetical protein
MIPSPGLLCCTSGWSPVRRLERVSLFAALALRLFLAHTPIPRFGPVQLPTLVLSAFGSLRLALIWDWLPDRLSLLRMFHI